MEAAHQAWIIDVNMGYGHSRAAHALKDLSGGQIISANEYGSIPFHDKKIWRESRQLYETISRMKPIPMVGNFLFEAMDYWQQIPAFYPRRDLSRPNMQLRQIYRLITKGWGKHLIKTISANPLPLITTFFIPAFFAEYHGYPGDIWCVTTDADVSRAWAPLGHSRSRIQYFASSGRVVERLQLYGVPKDHIYLTGFPLPKELIGGEQATIMKDLLTQRLCNLDPRGIFHSRYERTLKAELGAERCKRTSAAHPLTLTYSVGGAGAQKGLGVSILKSLKSRIAKHEIRLNLVAGVRQDTADYYQKAVIDAGLKKEFGSWICVPEFESREQYFSGFNELLKTTDILWTKPSELSFYCGLGIAIIMAPPIGSQEEFNRTWLGYVGGGVSQNDPRYTNEWLFDWIESGGVARMAWNGYIEAPTHGTYRIENLVLKQKNTLPELPLIV